MYEPKTDIERNIIRRARYIAELNEENGYKWSFISELVDIIAQEAFKCEYKKGGWNGKFHVHARTIIPEALYGKIDIVIRGMVRNGVIITTRNKDKWRMA